MQAAYNKSGGFLSSAELFNPTTDKFTKLEKSLSEARDGAIATTLPNGEVLIAGGHNTDGNLKSAELFDPSTGVFTELRAPNSPSPKHGTRRSRRRSRTAMS